jgi:hypothetical protein
MHADFQEEKIRIFRKNKFGKWPASGASRFFGRIFFDFA